MQSAAIGRKEPKVQYFCKVANVSYEELVQRPTKLLVARETSNQSLSSCLLSKDCVLPIELKHSV
jgi:predicted component of viral defense system (DUF524 family)